MADGGTLFLDEVGETSGPFQAKLLRALQEREVRPVGGTRSRGVDVRVIAATNRDLWREGAAGGFRPDLYFRLAVFPIHIPPLRERAGDVLRLARHFLETHGRAEGKPGVWLSAEAERLLEAHPWPGNVRELDNEIQRALALAEPGRDALARLPLGAAAGNPPADRGEPASGRHAARDARPRRGLADPRGARGPRRPPRPDRAPPRRDARGPLQECSGSGWCD